MTNQSLNSKRYYQRNLEVERKRRYDYFLTHKPDWKIRRLLKEYGLSIEEYHKLFKKQKGLCKICKSSISLCVDHNHKTGKVRGLLCSSCNKGLGLFKDDIKLLRKAVKYLE